MVARPSGQLGDLAAQTTTTSGQSSQANRAAQRATPSTIEAGLPVGGHARRESSSVNSPHTQTEAQWTPTAMQAQRTAPSAETGPGVGRTSPEGAAYGLFDWSGCIPGLFRAVRSSTGNRQPPFILHQMRPSGGHSKVSEEVALGESFCRGHLGESYEEGARGGSKARRPIQNRQVKGTPQFVGSHLKKERRSLIAEVYLEPPLCLCTPCRSEEAADPLPEAMSEAVDAPHPPDEGRHLRGDRRGRRD